MSIGIRGTEAMDQPIDSRAVARRRLLIAAAAAVVALIAFVAVQPLLSRWLSTDRSMSVARLRIAPVARGDIQHDFIAQGRIVAGQHLRLFSPADGQLILKVRPGELVRRGESLGSVSSPEILAALEGERSNLASLRSDLERQRIIARQSSIENRHAIRLAEVRVVAAERELERISSLREEGLINEAELERATDDLEIAKLELEQARQSAELEQEASEFQLRDASAQVERQRLAVAELNRRVRELDLLAPIEGLVTTIQVDDGNAVKLGQPILGLVDLSELEVEVGVPEAYGDEIETGGTVRILSEGRELPGTVAAVTPEVVESQVKVRAVFQGEAPAGLRQNQRVSVRFVLDRKEGVLKLPRGPYLESGGGRRIYVVEDGVASEKAIQVGIVSVDEVEVVSGLSEGDRVVLDSLELFAGAKRVLLTD